MTFVKFPEKSAGAKYTHEGHSCTCVENEYNGSKQLTWKWDENGENCFRRINGKIQIVLPNGESGKTESPKENTVVFPTVDQGFEDSISESLALEKNYLATAVRIVRERNPDLSENSGTFGMIVNATASRLISLR